MPARFLVLAIVATTLAYSPLFADEPAAAVASVAPNGVLRLADGDYVSGALSPNQDDLTVAWQHADFATPFAFPFSTLNTISFPSHTATTFAKGDFAFELNNGDRLYGTTIGLQEDFLQIEMPDGQSSDLPLKLLRRVFRWNAGDALIYAGPGELKDWKSNGGIDSWTDLGGSLQTDTPTATIFRDLKLPRMARVELDIAWEGTPNFVIAVGVDPDAAERTWADAFHIEVWDEQVVAVWEDGSLAGVAAIAKLKDLGNRLQLNLEINQATRQVMIESMRGEKLTQYKLPSKKPRIAQTGIYFRNISGNLRIQSLQVLQGSEIQVAGSQTKAMGTELSERSCVLYLADEKSIAGTLRSIAADEWTLEPAAPKTSKSDQTDSDETEAAESEDAESVTSVDPSKILVIDFPRIPDEQYNAPETTESVNKVQVKTHEGLRVTGRLQRVDDQHLHLIADATNDALAVPLSKIESIDYQPAKLTRRNQIGEARLELDGTRLHGKLIDTEPDATPTPLRFQPSGVPGTTIDPVTMLPGIRGRLNLSPDRMDVAAMARDRIAQARLAQVRQAPIRQRAKPAGVWGAFSRVFGNDQQTKSLSGKLIYLKTGEVIPAEIKSIDDNEVIFQSDFTQKTRLPRDQIRALHLKGNGGEPTVEEIERDRLLTVPRNRKKNPPTHLLVADNGDLMRCRLIRLTKDSAEVESRLETLMIPRDVISQIIWLKPAASEDDATDGSENSKPAEAIESEKQRVDFVTVQGRMRDGNRLSLVPESVINQTLIGENFLLGSIRLPLANCGELLFGELQPTAVAQEPYAIWRLVDAPEPIIAEGGGGEPMSGKGSPLVGQPAPDFTLKDLNGQPFQISKQVGKVLVLDFWATWCGPCMQAMPVIEETVAEFDTDDVRLVAVNLQESADDIRTTLDRIGVSPEVVLDIDGVAAGRYQASAIPQTVVIDREGNVTHVFIGGSSKLGESLSKAIKESLDEPAS